MRRKTAFVVLAAALGITSYRLVEQVGHDKKPSDRFTVVRVIDGDTVELTGGDKVRLLALDTPEKGEQFFGEAKRLVSTLSLGKGVRLEYGPTRRDHYGRLLGYLYVEDTLLVNRAVVDSGLAYVYLFSDGDLKSAEVRSMVEAQRRAMGRHRGIWSEPHAPETHYVASESSFRLHRPGCQSVAHRKEGHFRSFTTRDEGLAEGLSPCRNCKP